MDQTLPRYRLYLNEAQTALGREWPAPDDETEHEKRGAFHRTIRCALAMKGGVSLAVWIGGAVSELDVIRRVRIVGPHTAPQAYWIPPSGAEAAIPGGFEHLLSRADHYARLLASRGYDQIVFDVLAGASAGGLNSVLYGVAQRAGADVDGLLKVWEDAGRIWKLLRGPALLPVNSALQGDRYFWKKAREAIGGFYDGARNEEHVSDRVALELSATVVDHSMGGNSSGHFHFVGVDDEDIATMTGRGIPRDEVAADSERLAYAARTTSSFPGAFEPALIWSRDTDDPAPPPGDKRVDMTFAFHEHRALQTAGQVELPFRVIDGGVTDNIPIDRAYRTIRDQPADNYSNRMILYLNPDPPTLTLDDPPEPFEAPRLDKKRARRDARSRFVTTIASGIGLRGIRESAEAEIDEVEAFRRRLLLEQARNKTFSVVAGGPYDRAQAKTAYVLFRAAADYEQLYRVLTDPAVWQLQTDLPTRKDLPILQGSDLIDLEKRLKKTYKELANPAAVETGSQALMDFARCAIAWIRELEDDYFAASEPELDADPHAPIPRGKPDLLAQSEPARRRIRTMLWDVYLGARRLRDEDLAVIVALRVEKGARADVIPASWLTTQESHVDERADLWRKAGKALVDLQKLTKRFADTPLSSGFWKLVPVDASFSPSDLAPYLSARGIPEALSAIRFSQISGAEPAPVRFASLRRAQVASIVESWMPKRGRAFDAARATPIVGSLDANAKLAGSALANFGAFLSADWRRNDWWWGRMDAAAGLHRYLSARSVVRRGLLAKESNVPLVEDVLRQMNESDQRPYRRKVRNSSTPEAHVSRITEAMSAGAHSLSNLAPSYVFAVFSRLVRVAVRAVLPSLGLAKSIPVVILAPTIAVLAPLVFAPLRAAAIASILLATIGLTYDGAAGSGNGVAFLIAGLLYVAIAVYAAIQIGRGLWRRHLVSQDIVVSGPLGKPRLWYGGIRALVLLAGSGVAAGFAVREFADEGIATMPFWGLTAVAVVAAAAAAVGALKLPGKPSRVESTVAWLVVAAIPFVTLFCQDQTRAWLTTLVTPAVGTPFQYLLFEDERVGFFIAVTAIAAIMTYGWFGSVTSVRGILMLVWWAVSSLFVGVAAVYATDWVVGQFGGNALLTKAGVAGLVAWFTVTHLIWWLGEVLFFLAVPQNDGIGRKFTL